MVLQSVHLIGHELEIGAARRIRGRASPPAAPAPVRVAAPAQFAGEEAWRCGRRAAATAGAAAASCRVMLRGARSRGDEIAASPAPAAPASKACGAAYRCQCGPAAGVGVPAVAAAGRALLQGARGQRRRGGHLGEARRAAATVAAQASASRPPSPGAATGKGGGKRGEGILVRKSGGYQNR